MGPSFLPRLNRIFLSWIWSEISDHIYMIKLFYPITYMYPIESAYPTIIPLSCHASHFRPTIITVHPTIMAQYIIIWKMYFMARKEFTQRRSTKEGGSSSSSHQTSQHNSCRLRSQTNQMPSTSWQSSALSSSTHPTVHS